jgi:hypothetical protein
MTPVVRYSFPAVSQSIDDRIRGRVGRRQGNFDRCVVSITARSRTNVKPFARCQVNGWAPGG